MKTDDKKAAMAKLLRLLHFNGFETKAPPFLPLPGENPSKGANKEEL